MYYEINALDSLFFRDAAPFSVATDIYAKSIFPPLPSVYYGALRSVYFSRNMDDFKNANTDSDPTLKLRIGLTALKYQNLLMFPQPLDTEVRKVIKNQSESYQLSLLSLKEVENVSSYPLSCRLTSSCNDKESQVSGGLFFNQSELENYLNGTETEFASTPLQDLITRERRVGIKINRNTRITEDKLFYQMESVRLENEKTSIILDISGMALPDEGMIKLGGRAKGSFFKKSEKQIKIELSQKNADYFKLYFSTPTYFENGWYPKWISGEDFIGEFPANGHKIKCKLVAAAVGRYVGAGGYDMKEKRPKKMKYDIPAGSVYYFKLLEGSFSDAQQLFHMKNICDDISDANQGFGFCFVGNVRGENQNV